MELQQSITHREVMDLFEIKVPSGQSNEDLQLLQYAFSHDLRASLRPILGLSPYLAKAEVPGDKSEQYQEKVIESARRLERKLDALSEYARLCTRVARRQKVELEPLLQTVARQQLARHGRAEGCVEMSGDFPAVRADQTALKIVFSELMSNALQFAAPGREPRVRLEAQARQGRVETSVRDCGLGIPAECLALLGKPFQRFHEGPGVGLGLALALRALALAPGRMHYSDSGGEGSHFVVWLEAA